MPRKANTEYARRRIAQDDAWVAIKHRKCQVIESAQFKCTRSNSGCCLSAS